MLALVTLFAASPSAAQESGDFTLVSIDPAAALSVPDVVRIPLNKARLYKFTRDVRDVVVSNPAIVNVVVKTPRLVYIVGVTPGDSNLFFIDSKGNEIASLDVHVALDTDSLSATLADLMPADRIEVNSVGVNIILRGTARSARSVVDAGRIAARFAGSSDNVINMIKVAGGQQVMLRVRIAEMQRSIVKELGFNITAIVNGGDFAFDSGAPSGTAFGTAALGVVNPFSTRGFDLLSAAIDALEAEGMVKTLAEPNLVAVSGENANFVVGGEFPIPVAQEEGVITVEFRSFGVVLSFTPVVLDSGLISLKIATEVSQVSVANSFITPNFTIPGLTINRTETTVELPSGGGLVIAGLLQDDIRNAVNGLPGLKDIPILGALFRSVAFQKEETELVVAVTAYLVRSVDPQNIVLPTDGFAPASDFDMYLLGRLHDVYAVSAASEPAGSLQGPIGFIME
jgi:pilus assembly protein CpaC